MPGRLNLDCSPSMAAAIGPGLGLDPRDLRALLPRFAAVHAASGAAGDGGWSRLAALTPGASGPAQAWGDALRRDGRRVILLGEPGAVAAALALPRAGGLDEDRVAVVSAPDAAALQRALQGEPAHLLVLDGPAWVRALVAAIADRVAGISVVPRSGASDAAWPGADVLTGPGDADPRFGVLGPAALGLLALAGVELDPVLEEVGAVARMCAASALFENPAYRLAATLLAARDRGVDHLVLLLPTPRLLGWASWCARAWAGLTARVARDVDGVQRHGGVRVSALCLGDEAGLQSLVEGAADALTVAVWAEAPGVDQALSSRMSVWGLARTLHSAHVRQQAAAGRPLVQLRLAALDAPSVAGASTLMLYSALALAVALELDPIAMPAAARWRAMTDEALPLAPPNGDSP